MNRPQHFLYFIWRDEVFYIIYDLYKNSNSVHFRCGETKNSEELFFVFFIKIFDRFFTTDRDGGGTGLGLAIVQAVADTRGGEVRLETGPQGSTFTLIV